MFVFSVRTSRRRLWLLLLCAAAVAVLLSTALLWPASGAACAPAAADTAAQAAFLRALGYEVEEDSCEVREVALPAEPDEALAAYNELQKAAGMDLAPYCGRRLKCWSWRILNADGAGETVAHLYLYKDTIVGGDISETAADGKMTGLLPRR